jgi:hypothetical protein
MTGEGVIGALGSEAKAAGADEGDASSLPIWGT